MPASVPGQTTNSSVPGSVPAGGLPAGGAPAGVDVKALTTCLGERGVTVDPTGPPDFSDPKLQAALQACAAYLPSGVGAAVSGDRA